MWKPASRPLARPETTQVTESPGPESARGGGRRAGGLCTRKASGWQPGTPWPVPSSQSEAGAGSKHGALPLMLEGTKVPVTTHGGTPECGGTPCSPGVKCWLLRSPEGCEYQPFPSPFQALLLMSYKPIVVNSGIRHAGQLAQGVSSCAHQVLSKPSLRSLSPLQLSQGRQWEAATARGWEISKATKTLRRVHTRLLTLAPRPGHCPSIFGHN